MSVATRRIAKQNQPNPTLSAAWRPKRGHGRWTRSPRTTSTLRRDRGSSTGRPRCPTRPGRVVALCHPRTHFTPEPLTYSVALFLKRRCDRTLGPTCSPPRGSTASRSRRESVRGIVAARPRVQLYLSASAHGLTHAKTCSSPVGAVALGVGECFFKQASPRRLPQG